MTFYEFAKKIFRFQFRLMGWRLVGVENMPAEGPVILAVNHQSLWDPLVTGSSLPRKVSFMAKEELFSIPVLGNIFRKMGAFPVKRGQGDMNAIRHSLAILKEGGVLGLFPEGTRSKDGELQKGLPGMVFLMEKSKATVVPVKMFGTRKLLIKGWGKIVVVVGKPMTPQMLQAPEGVENRREWIANRIMEAMLELTDEK